MTTPRRSQAGEPILLIDDDASLRTVLCTELGRMGFRVDALPDATEATARVRAQRYDAVLLDLNLPGIGGMEALRAMLAVDADLRVVVFTGQGTVERAVAAMRAGAADFLTKPVSLDVLEQTLRRTVGTTALVREGQRLRRLTETPDPGALALPSRASRELHEQLERIGRSDQAVLIEGESGAGKELAARRLHACSARAEAPFVVVNCGAVPRNLLESELFGHVRGAFTGADRRRLGLFEAADGGTLFLDEVGELPLEVQPTLLRAVQFGEVRPVGGGRVRNGVVRVIAATHRNLRAMQAAGTFREDLFYRLAVIEVRVPPLRERPEDVPVLADALLARACRRSGRELRLGAAAHQVLAGHPWPGNVRELENAMVRLAVLVDGPEIGAAEVLALATGAARERGGPLPTLRVADLEALAIAEAMRRFGGNKRQAAEALGVSLKTLYNKLNAEAGPDAG